jgi:hypothetical protein
MLQRLSTLLVTGALVFGVGAQAAFAGTDSTTPVDPTETAPVDPSCRGEDDCDQTTTPTTPPAPTTPSAPSADEIPHHGSEGFKPSGESSWGGSGSNSSESNSSSTPTPAVNTTPTPVVNTTPVATTVPASDTGVSPQGGIQAGAGGTAVQDSGSSSLLASFAAMAALALAGALAVRRLSRDAE